MLFINITMFVFCFSVVFFVAFVCFGVLIDFQTVLFRFIQFSSDFRYGFITFYFLLFLKKKNHIGEG